MITFSQLGNLGRLGNQLWQIGVSISLGLRMNDEVSFPFWGYEKQFNVLSSYFTDTVISRQIIYKEPYFHYAPIPHTPKAGECLDLVGYFQSYLYLDDRVKEMLTPKIEFKREEGLCSIHVRRGDYVHQPHNHPTQPMNYYQKAMELSGCSRFLVFSDDIPWCRKNFVGNQFEFSEGNSEVIDMAMMAKRCSSNIICNSSFSWWGAYLNQNPNKVVIYPANWFGPGQPHKIDDLCPSEWIEL